MKRIMLLLLIAVGLLPGSGVYAKLSVLPPDEMLQNSDLIAVGTVEKRETREDRRSVEIRVTHTLKGDVQEPAIRMEREKPPMYGWLGFDFPEAGSRVMVLLRKQEQGYTMTADLNNVAVIDSVGNVKLYRGSAISGQGPDAYEQTYQAYYEKHNTPNLLYDVVAVEVAGEGDQGMLFLAAVLGLILIGIVICVIRTAIRRFRGD